MPVNLVINGRATEVATGPTLFDYAEGLGVRVPTSCQKNGKCKECMVEVVEGMACLSAPTAFEQHLKSPFRLSCQCHVVAGAGTVRCHTMRRGQMRIEGRRLGLPAGQTTAVDAFVT